MLISFLCVKNTLKITVGTLLINADRHRIEPNYSKNIEILTEC